MQYSRSEQLGIIRSILVKEGDRKTLDCPFCGGRKKFTISKIDGKLVWNCYRASCTVKGAHNSGRSISAIKNKLSNTKIPVKRNDIPDILSDVDNHPDVVSYLKSVNSYGAYKDGLIDIRYAPAHNRVLFFTADKQGAVGRALDNRSPKWWTFGDTSMGIKVGNSKEAVIVEDAASACSVSRIKGLTGFALLGTNITTPIKAQLRHLTKVTITLDLDASSKALLLAKKIQPLTEVKVRLTKEDLKWLSGEQIQNLLR